MRAARLKPVESGYGILFERRKRESALEQGKRHLEDALQVLARRLSQNRELRRLPLTEKKTEILTAAGFEFLAKHNAGSFEKDNLAHIQRLVIAMRRFGSDLKEFLGLDYKEVQLLAVLHDLGKSLAHENMLAFLQTIFGEKDFTSLRVLPHELYSMYWIQDICRRHSVEDTIVEALIDQIANHNFGPDLSDPINRDLLSKGEDGAFRHWWLAHWMEWSSRVREKGIAIDFVYGHTVSPLATTLVLFDRIDGGELHSWEKYLNQDLISGAIELSPSTVLQSIKSAAETSGEQILAVGRQLKATFLPSNLKLEEFTPYLDALQMQRTNDEVAKRLNLSNDPAKHARFRCSVDTNILYEGRTGTWYRIDGFSKTRETGRKFQWRNDRWYEIDQNDSPISLLMETLYGEEEESG